MPYALSKVRCLLSLQQISGKELVSFSKRDIIKTMKKQTILFITIFILIILLTGCASSKFSSSQLPKDGALSAEEVNTPAEFELPDSETSGGAEPALSFSTAGEAVKEIKAVKAAGPEKMAHPDDFKLYEKDYIYLLKENPFPSFKRETIMVVLQGTAILYQTDGYEKQAMFMWNQGYETDEIVEERIHRFSLKRYADTKFFFGKHISDICIFWWEDGDQFYFMYPADANVPPEDIIEHLEVEKYDL